MNKIYNIELPKSVTGKELTSLIEIFASKNKSTFLQTNSVPPCIIKKGDGDYVLGFAHQNGNKDLIFLSDNKQKYNTFSDNKQYDNVGIIHHVWDTGLKGNYRITTQKVEKQITKTKINLEAYLKETI